MTLFEIQNQNTGIFAPTPTNTYVTNGHGYVPPVVNTIPCFVFITHII